MHKLYKNSHKSIIDCECCKHRFAQRQYSDRGSLCEKCENHFDDRGRLQEQYPWEAGLNFVSTSYKYFIS